jgi:hypothetical protein
MHRIRWWFLLALLVLAIQPGIATVTGIASGPRTGPVPGDAIMLPGGLPIDEPDSDCG